MKKGISSPKEESSMKNLSPMVVGLVALLVGASGGFFGGMQYQKSQAPTFNRGQFGASTGFGGNGTNGGMMSGRAGGVGGAGGRGSFRPVNGEIISTDDKSITVKLTDGSSKIVMLSDKTSINKADTVSKDQLTVGTKVAVFGSEDTAGTVTAQNIQVNPMFRMMGGDGLTSPSPAPTK